jgi:hypothetical protein
LLHFLVRLACVRHAASVDSEPGSNSRLKPDACRRVVGRLPSPHIQISLQKPFWFQQRGMAPPFSLRSPFRTNPKKQEKFMVVYLVRSFRTYARIRSLTTGTFNRVVKDRIAFRLSGAPSGLDGPAFLGRTPSKNGSGCPRNPTNIQCGLESCNQRVPQNFHAFSTTGKRVGKRHRRAQPAKINQPESNQPGSNRKPCHERVVIPNGRSPRGTCFSTLTRSSEARNSMAFRLGIKDIHRFRRMPRRKTRN